MKPLALIVDLLLLARADAAEELSNDMSATEGVEKTALLSFPERFCELTELSEPRAHIVFALQIKGKITYFKTKTRCSDFPGRKLEHPIFGEKVRLFGGNRPTAIRRETGAFYQVDPTDPIRMYFDPGATHNLYEAPRYEEHRQHEQVMMECLLLIDTKERDLCLWYQAGHEKDTTICDQMSDWKRAKCKRWLANITGGAANE